MDAVLTALQFAVGCLAIGLGLYVSAATAQELYRQRVVVLPAAGVTVLLGASLVLLGAGAYAAYLAVPL